MAVYVARFVVDVEAAADGGGVGGREGPVAGVDVGVVAGPGGELGPGE